MADFRIRYARTSDGVSIAWATEGSGSPIVFMPPVPYGNVQMTPMVAAHVHEALTHAGQLYWYDARGTGMSDRGAVDFSIDAMMRDFEAIAVMIGEPVTVIGVTGGARLALAAAATFPEMVTGVIATDVWGWDGSVQDTPAAQMELVMRGQDPALYAKLVAQLLFDFAPVEVAGVLASYIENSCDFETLMAGVRANDEQDISDLVPRIRQPVLVTHGKFNQWAPVRTAQELVSLLPNGELALVEDRFFGDSIPHWLRFLGAEAKTSTEPSSFRTILFTDLEGHSSLMSRLGDSRGREYLREHERLTREALRAHRGSEVKSMGDGFMASFGSAQSALDCAIALQRAFAGPVEGETLRIRIGVNAGEPVAEDNDLFGASVIAAARVAAMAEGGQVLVANVVRELVAGKGFLFHDTGMHDLRGLEEPVRLWELLWE